MEALRQEIREKNRVIVRLTARLRHMGEAAQYLEEEGIVSPVARLPQLEFTAFNSSTIDLFEAARRSVATGSARDPDGVALSDVDSIRRRYVALDGNNPDAIAHLNPKTLFKPTFAVEYADDSPTFRKKVGILDKSVEGLREHLTSMVSWMRKYCGACSTFAMVGKKLASRMMHLEPESWFTRMGDLAPHLVRFGEILDEVQSNNDALALSIETAFSSPMEDFVSREVKEVNKLRVEMSQAMTEHESAIFKYLQLRPKGDDSLAQAKLEEVLLAKEKFELARFDMVNTLNSLEKKKKFQLVERLCSVFYSYLGYFHRCHVLFAAQEPFLRDLQRCVQQARKDFAREEKLRQAKRLQLKAELGIRPEGHRLSVSTNDSGEPTSKPKARRNRSTPDGFTPTALMRRVIGLGFEDDEAAEQQPSGLSVNGEIRTRRPSTQKPALVSKHIQTAEDTQVTIQREGSTIHPDHENRPSSLRLPRPSDALEENICSTPVVHSPTTPRSYELTDDDIEEITVVDGLDVVKHGFLWKRSTNLRKEWQRRWFILREGKLSYIRQEQQDSIGPPVVIISDILLCTVRECKGEGELKFCFEVISPKQRSYKLQAESDVDYHQWIKAIRDETERLLAGSKTFTSELDVTGSSVSVQRAQAQHLQCLAYREEIFASNPFCAECGAASPDWISLNICVCICIECSGVHRSLGVQVSKVRSLTLDKLPMYNLQLIIRLGNAKVNEIWEKNIPEGYTKPSATSPASVKREWILNKYTQKLFLGPSNVASPNLELYTSASHDDLVHVMTCLAFGADINFKNPNDQYRTPLHAASIADHVLTVEFLCLNGASLEPQDENERTPLDLAMDDDGPSHNCIDVLVAKIERELF